MDFVLRDAYMSGYNARAFDLERLLHYSFFTPQGLTIHSRGMAALVQFMGVRADLFRTIYFHRTVRAIDLTLADLFAESKAYLFPGQPVGTSRRVPALHRMVVVGRRGPLADGGRRRQRALGERWQAFLNRQIPWKMACQRNLVFDAAEAERSSIFSQAEFVERELRAGAAGVAGGAADASRPGAAHPSPRHARTEPWPEFLLGPGPRRTSPVDRRSIISAVATEPPHLPGLCAGRIARPATGRRARRAIGLGGHRRRDQHVSRRSLSPADAHRGVDVDAADGTGTVCQ